MFIDAIKQESKKLEQFAKKINAYVIIVKNVEKLFTLEPKKLG